MTYQMVFDASQKPPDLWFLALPAGFALLALLMVLGVIPVRSYAYRRTQRRWTRRFIWGFPVVFMALSAFQGAFSAYLILSPYMAARSALASGEVAVVEGRVESFHPMPAEGHDTERFRVGGVHFAYSDFILTPGFNTTASHGGPIREGLPVRITYMGPPDDATILKLETARQG
jgi:hypothetical protein